MNYLSVEGYCQVVIQFFFENHFLFGNQSRWCVVKKALRPQKGIINAFVTYHDITLSFIRRWKGITPKIIDQNCSFCLKEVFSAVFRVIQMIYVLS